MGKKLVFLGILAVMAFLAMGCCGSISRARDTQAPGNYVFGLVEVTGARPAEISIIDQDRRKVAYFFYGGVENKAVFTMPLSPEEKYSLIVMKGYYDDEGAFAVNMAEITEIVFSEKTYEGKRYAFVKKINTSD